MREGGLTLEIQEVIAEKDVTHVMQEAHMVTVILETPEIRESVVEDTIHVNATNAETPGSEIDAVILVNVTESTVTVTVSTDPDPQLLSELAMIETTAMEITGLGGQTAESTSVQKHSLKSGRSTGGSL